MEKRRKKNCFDGTCVQYYMLGKLRQWLHQKVYLFFSSDPAK
jgi:hypothetical protein